LLIQTKYPEGVIMKSIKLKVVVSTSSILLVVCLGFGIISYITSSRALISEVQSDLPQLADQTAKVITSRLDGEFRALKVIAQDEVISDMGLEWGKKEETLSQEAQVSGNKVLGVADLKGTLKTTDGKIIDIADKEYYKEALLGKEVVSDPVVDNIDGTVTITFAVPIMKENKAIGVLISRTDGYILSDMIKDITYAKTGKAFIINKEGTVIAHTNRNLVKTRDNVFNDIKKDSKLQQLYDLQKIMIKGKLGFGQYSYDGAVKYMAYAPVGDTGWCIGIATPKGEVISGLDGLLTTCILLAAVFFVLSFIAGFFIANSISKPLKLVSEHLDIISSVILQKTPPKGI
jgi:methyl-accepting chemotaxis protein